MGRELGHLGIGSTLVYNRDGVACSPQYSVIGDIDTSGEEFHLPRMQAFNIKNNGSTAVTLTVQLAGMDGFVDTPFQPGWNPEIVIAIQTNGESNLQYGY